MIGAGLVLVCLAVLLGILVDTEFSRVTRSLGGRTIPAGEITAGTRLGQTFLATESDLSRVEVLLATYRRINHAPLLFSLEEYPADKAPLRTVIAEPESIGDNEFYAFEFPPIPDSAGRAFLLTLESPEGAPGDAFTAWLVACDCYLDGSPFLNGAEQPELELAFRVGYGNGGISVRDVALLALVVGLVLLQVVVLFRYVLPRYYRRD